LYGLWKHYVQYRCESLLYFRIYNFYSKGYLPCMAVFFPLYNINPFFVSNINKSLDCQLGAWLRCLPTTSRSTRSTRPRRKAVTLAPDCRSARRARRSVARTLAPRQSPPPRRWTRRPPSSAPWASRRPKSSTSSPRTPAPSSSTPSRWSSWRTTTWPLCATAVRQLLLYFLILCDIWFEVIDKWNVYQYFVVSLLLCHAMKWCWYNLKACIFVYVCYLYFVIDKM